ncbi:carbonic anhydrase [Candidatus Mancarchaeum acidiphilum]|uniref:Carbonic anhydrase n=1 Tax=Candidatus Mancarchaeum acidiphilum TaxID=1920749 RepID=A0A218NMA0_9ARCH|nr:carbonic anhydrase [Candidatus Mancarchaeum acidiphilum]ASI13597.1 carbonic anhydrase [Candidatus Mancarchaeum acidiphilum]
MNKLVISCMDRRLNDLIEEQYSDCFIIRNAGANVYPVAKEIKDLIKNKDIREIILLAHTDCGAMNKVFGIIKRGKSADPDLEESLISQYRKLDFDSIDELEKDNLNLQVDKLKSEFPETKIDGRLIRIEDIKVPKDDKIHELILANPSKPGYSGLLDQLSLNHFSAYILQSDTNNIMPDLKLAVADLGVKFIHLISIEKENPRDRKVDQQRLNLIFGKDGVKISIYSYPLKA